MAAWQDYHSASQLTLVFGKVDARVEVLGRDASGVENHFGVIVHPYDTAELVPGSAWSGTDPTREQAKAQAVQMLSVTLANATRELPSS